jgi:transglutaminase-like putative cysteine protease
VKLSIRYLTTFTYDTAVNESHNALRAKPEESSRQRLLDYRVEVDPPGAILSHVDYWGTWVDTFSVVGRHTQLSVLAESHVDTTPISAPTNSPLWDPTIARENWYEYISPSPHVAWDDRVAAIAKRVADGKRDAVAVALAVVDEVAALLTYEPGTTEVGTSVDEILERGGGVCQDYAHLALAVYRSAGIPARYISGYLYATDSSLGDDPDVDEIHVATHAWVEVHIPGFGWWGLDPTNRLVVGERHVKIGHGRDYEDVMPLRGVYHGDAESGGLEVAVTMSRTDLDHYTFKPRPASFVRAEAANGSHYQQQ